MNWTKEEHGQKWRGTAEGGWTATVTVNLQEGIYVAAVQQEDDEVQHIAPESFDTIEAAQEWCETEISERKQGHR